MIFERFIFQYLTTLPPGITEDYYLVYGLQALVIIGVFSVGILLVPSLTSSIFSGRGGGSVLPGAAQSPVRRGRDALSARTRDSTAGTTIHTLVPEGLRDRRADRASHWASGG